MNWGILFKYAGYLPLLSQVVTAVHTAQATGASNSDKLNAVVTEVSTVAQTDPHAAAAVNSSTVDIPGVVNAIVALGKALGLLK